MIRERIKSLYKIIYKRIAFPLIKRLYVFLPIKKNKIVFDNFGGKGFADNPRYIAEEIGKRNIPVDMVWLVNKSDTYSFPNYIREVHIGTIRGIYERATARIWVDNIRNIHPIKKRKGQIYLQTWHAPFSPKLLERDAEDKLSVQYCKEAQYDGLITDGIIVNSELHENQYRRAFWLNNKTEYLRFGLPRYDYLIKHKNDLDLMHEIREKYNISQDDYVIFYAPTFRDDYSVDGYKIDFNLLIEAFEQKTGKKAIFIVRLHPNVDEKSVYIEYSEKIINGSNISDIQELSIISNCIITDYSSSMYDFVLLDRPVFLCALDLEQYEKIRGLLPEFYEFPFPFARSNEELIDNIMRFNKNEYEKRVKEYFELHPMYDQGDASIRVVDWIVSKMEGRKNNRYVKC